MQKHRVLGAALVFLFTHFQFLNAVSPQEKLPLRKLNMCGKNYMAWVATKEEDRTRGLMNFRELKKSEAMLFVFSEEKPLSFWMKNVPHDLDIAYFNAQKKLVSVHTMKATSPLMKEDQLPAYSSSGPAMYAVEVKGNTLGKVPKNCRLVF